jgi:predicted RecA/RadA family phage recombinase
VSSNFVQRGDTLDFVAPTGGVTAGLPVKIGSAILIASATVAAGVKTCGYRVGVYDVKAEGAASGQDMAFGDLVYWDDTNKRVTKTSSSNTKIGFFANTTGKASTDTVARVCVVSTI